MKHAIIKLIGTWIGLVCLTPAGHTESLVSKTGQSIRNIVQAPWQAGSRYFWAQTELNELDPGSGTSLYLRRTLAYDVGLELGYFSTDDLDFQEDVGVQATNSTQAVTLSLSGQGETGFYNSTFYAKLGIARWDETTDLSPRVRYTDSGTSPFVGLSLQKPLSHRISIGLDSNYYLDMVRGGWLWDVGLGFDIQLKD